MFDSEKLAILATNYSLPVNEKMRVGIKGNAVATPLIQQLYKHTLLRGGYPELLVDLEGIEELFYAYANPDQIAYVSPVTRHFLEDIDGLLSIRADTNTRKLTNVPSEKIKEKKISLRPIMDVYHRHVKQGGLSIIPYPAPAYAQEAEMSLFDYEDFVEKACFLDKEDPVKEWKKLSSMQQRIVERLNKVKVLRLVGQDTDLTVYVKGRTWINCDGRINMPDGEVFTAPIENSAQGYIRFSYPGIYEGKEIENIYLAFKNGQVVEAKAEKGQELLSEIRKVEGIDRIGEIAIGTNTNITRFTKVMLFDEKMGHCIHLALGNSFQMTGGQNRSSIHWDILKDMKSGEIYADKELIYKDGQILI